jgi:hypothetical protein
MPAPIFHKNPELKCARCGKDLLTPKPHGVVVIWERNNEEGQRKVEHVYWCCKGTCDRILASRIRDKDMVDGWEDIEDLAIPIVYLRWIAATLNSLGKGRSYDPKALGAERDLLIGLFPHISRSLTSKGKERIRNLMMIPGALGGLG